MIKNINTESSRQYCFPDYWLLSVESTLLKLLCNLNIEVLLNMLSNRLIK